MENRIKPTTQIIGAKANQLLHELARENGVSTKYFVPFMLLREARSEATMLDGERLKKRLALIEDVQTELTLLINNPPREMLSDWDYSTKPKSIYMRVWQAHKRLEGRGASEEEIHKYCIDHYGIDFPVKQMPQRSPKANPEWAGGGARRKIEVK